MVQIELPVQVERIIGKLNEFGYEAFAVGGCVRDSLLGRSPKDWDITTSAGPEQIKKIFRRTVDTGIRHGTVTVIADGQGYEVTTYRVDGEYEDGRHPNSVTFTSNLSEDLKRRDFTINAMAYSHRAGLIDEFGGQEDLKAGVVRCVGDPAQRFREDALRMLRALRFSAQLGFQIHRDTRSAILKLSSNMEKISKERIQAELTLLLLSGRPESISAVFETGVSPYISRRFAGVPYSPSLLDRETPPVKHFRWAGFLRQASRAEAEGVLRDLKMDCDTILRTGALVEMWRRRIPADKVELRKSMSRLNTALFNDLLLFRRVYCPGLPPEERFFLSDCGSEEEFQNYLGEVERKSLEIQNDGDCISLKTLAVSGKDLIAAGMNPGKELGEVLNRMLEIVLECPECNSKEFLFGKFGLK